MGGVRDRRHFLARHLLKSCRVEQVRLISKGFYKGKPYYASMPDKPTMIRDSTLLNWNKNQHPYFNLLHLDYKQISHEVLMEIEAFLMKID